MLDGRKPVALDRFPKPGSLSAGYKGRIDDIGAFEIVVAVGVVGVLKAGSDEDCRSVLEDVDGAVSMMNIEIKDGYPFHFFMGESCGSTHCDIVVKAEPHPSVVFGMVPRWPGAGEDTFALPGQDEIDGFFEGPGGQPCSPEGSWRQVGIGIDSDEAGSWGALGKILEVKGLVDPLEGFFADGLWFSFFEGCHLSSILQVSKDRLRAFWPFRVPVVHTVLIVGGMSKE